MWDSRQTNTISGRTRTGVFAWFFNLTVGQHTAAPTDLIAQSLKHVFQKSMDRPSILREFEGSGRFTRLYGMRVKSIPTFLGIVTARSGSTGIKNKNIKPMNGHPLMAFSIQAARKSHYLTDFIVSTDSRKYANIANQYGARVPFLRPNHLAEDTSPTEPVLMHGLLEYEKFSGIQFDYVVLLQPTSPLTRISHTVCARTCLPTKISRVHLETLRSCLITAVTGDSVEFLEKHE